MSTTNSVSDLTTPKKGGFLKVLGIVALAFIIIAALGAIVWRMWPRSDTDANPVKYGYLCDVAVRIYDGEDPSWHSNLDVHRGDVIEVRIEYCNLSSMTQYDVGCWVNLPNGIHYFPGTGKFYNASNAQSGGIIIGDDITGTGVNLGDYAGYEDVGATHTFADGTEQPAGANSVICFAIGIRNNGSYDGATVGMSASTEAEKLPTQIVPINLNVIEDDVASTDTDENGQDTEPDTDQPDDNSTQDEEGSPDQPDSAET